MRSWLLIVIGMSLLTDALAQQVVFNGQVAPIIYKNCTPCHSKGEVGPFPLSNYKEVASKAKQIDRVVTKRIMPPWKADPSYSHFANEKLLTDEEIKLVSTWVQQGVEEGKKNKTDEAYKISGISSMAPGGEYLEIKMKDKYEIAGNNDDWVVQFIIPVEIDNEREISNIDFIPDNRQAIHHANYKVVQYSPKYDKKIRPLVLSYPHDNPNDDPFDEPFKVEDIVYYGGWLPGSTPMLWPEGCGFKLPKRFYIQFKIHYAPTTVTQFDQSSIRLYYAEKPLLHTVKFRNIGSFGGIAEPVPLLILPPDSIKSYNASFHIPDSMNLIYIIPHMHLLGTNFNAYYIQPTGDTVPIIKIKDWNFNWQEFYKLPANFVMPPNATIEINGTFDNTTGNRFNRFNPPKWVRQGVSTYDEMMSMVMIYYSP